MKKRKYNFLKSECEGVRGSFLDKTWIGSRMWISEINIDGEKKHLGTFKKEVDAVKAYELALICVKENRINDIEKPIIEQHLTRPEQTNLSGSAIGVTHHTKIVDGIEYNYLMPYWKEKK